MTAAIQTGGRVCDNGCCVVTIDPSLGVPAIYSRPMFQVLGDGMLLGDLMTVRAEDYALPGGVLL